MIKTSKKAVLATAAFFLAGGCDAPERSTPSDPVALDPVLGPGRVAVVDGEPIPESVFRLYALNLLQKSADDLTPAERETVLDDLVSIKVLEQAAKADGLPQERTIAADLELQRMRLLANAVARRHIQRNPITDAEVRAAYETHLPRLSATQYKARHILLSSEAEAAAVIEQLQDGADFHELEREHTVGPGAQEAGDLGWFTLDTTVGPFADAIRSMEVGTFSSQPVRTQFGWHVILLEDAQAPQPPDMEEIRSELEAIIEQERIERFIESLRERAEVEEFE